MPIKFNPRYALTQSILENIERLNALKQQVDRLPLNAKVIASLRESAKLYTTHYSTMIEGNRLTVHEVQQVIEFEGHFAGRERDEQEVRGYYNGLDYIDAMIQKKRPIAEKDIRSLHALVVGKKRPTPYRDGQNVIRDSASRRIVYLPPEAHDVPLLMQGLVEWLTESPTAPLIKAAVAHYQFATIHPYYDGNGRTARLLTTYIMHASGYSFKGLYALEEYYARDLPGYYAAISIGPSHNYYMGREEADITPWIEYFMKGAVFACEKVLKNIQKIVPLGDDDHESLLRELDGQKKKALSLFEKVHFITSAEVGKLFGFQPRTSSHLTNKWVQEGFLEIVDSSKKGRKFSLAPRYKELIHTIKRT